MPHLLLFFGAVASPQGSSLERLKQVAAEQRRSTGSAAAPPTAAAQQAHSHQHSPQPCLSQSALSSLGGSRRVAASAGSPPPASSAVAVASLLGEAAHGSQEAPQEGPAADQPQARPGSKLSTPVEELLRESARIISSLDLGDRDGGGAFGSAIIASEAAAAASNGELRDTAGTPDGAVVSVAVESEAGFSTPRGAATHSQSGAPAAVPALGTAAQRYAGASAEEGMAAAGRAAAVQGGERPAAAASHGGRSMSQVRLLEACWGARCCRLSPAALACANANALPLPALPKHFSPVRPPPCPMQMRQRSLQHLSPTSTPLSSLGRQSSRSSVVSSDAGGSTPASSMPARASLLRHSTSPLGAAQQAPHPGGAAASQALRFPDLPTGQAALPPPLAAARAGQQAQLRASYQEQQLAEDMYAYSSDEEETPAAAARRAAAQEAEAAEVLAAARPPAGFGALHSRASSCDLAFYAPFTLHQMGQSEQVGVGVGG